MPTGAISSHVDVAQLTLYAFWIFFAGLIVYLRREDKREGYPLEHDLAGCSGREGYKGMPPPPGPKTFLLRSGATVAKPDGVLLDPRVILAKPARQWAGSPLEPTGNPLVDAVGPASHAMRADVPDTTVDGDPKIVPMRVATDFWLPEGEADPRGLPVVAVDGVVAATVREIWVDRSEVCARYYEIEIPTATGTRSALLPINFTRFKKGAQQINVLALQGQHFADIPALKNPDQVTFLEEDRIVGYFAGGKLYAESSRLGPLF